jgi:hypothetical protein
MENLDSNNRISRKYLLGSKAADVITGIVAGILWWVAGGLIASCCRPSNIGFIMTFVICAFIGQVVAIRAGRDESGIFIVSEVLTVVLIPLIAVGLVLGACMFAGHIRM